MSNYPGAFGSNKDQQKQQQQYYQQAHPVAPHQYSQPYQSGTGYPSYDSTYNTRHEPSHQQQYYHYQQSASQTHHYQTYNQPSTQHQHYQHYQHYQHHPQMQVQPHYQQPPQFQMPAIRRRKALLIGINYFNTKSELRGQCGH
jgi:hypothetical protein